MPASNDGQKPRRSSQPYLPPPPSSDEDLPESVRVPRAQHPPASLQALLKGVAGKVIPVEPPIRPWTVLGILLLLAAAIIAYLLQ